MCSSDLVEAPAEVLKTYVDVSEAANINELEYLFEQSSSKNQYDVTDIRGPSFTNLQVLPHMLQNCLVADAVAVISTVDPIMGEVDR